MQTTLLGLAIAFIIALVAALVGPHFVDWTRFRPQFEAEASRILGTAVRVNGALDARLLPTPSLRLQSVVIGGANDPGRIRAERLDVEFSLGSLMRGEWRATDLTVNGVALDLGLDQNGRVDWPVSAGSPNLAGLSIDRFNLTGRVALHDAASRSTLELNDIAFSGDIRGASGSIRGNGNFLLDGTRYPFRLSSAQDNDTHATRVHLSLEPGLHGLTVDLDGALKFEARRPLFDGTIALAKAAPDGTAPDSVTPLRLSAKLKADPAKASLAQLEVNYGFDETALKLTGVADFRFGGRPLLQALLSAKQLDADKMLAKGSSTAEPAQMIPGLRALLAALPQAPLPTRIDINAERIILGGRPVQDLDLTLRADTGAWRVDRLEVRAPGATEVSIQGAMAASDNADDPDAERSFKGALKVDSSDPGIFAAWLLGRSDIASRKQKPMHVAGNVHLASDAVAIDNLNADVDGGRMIGRIAWSARRGGEASSFDADLSADRLDLDAASELVRAMGIAQADWPDRGQLALNIAEAISSGQQLRPFAVKLGYDAHALVLDKLRVGQANGLTVDGSGVFHRENATGQLALQASAPSVGRIADVIAPWAPVVAERLQADAARTPGAARVTLDLDLHEDAADKARVRARAALDVTTPQLRAKATLQGAPSRDAIGRVDVAALKRSELRADIDASSANGAVLLTWLGLDRALATDATPARLTGSAEGRWDAPWRIKADLSAGPLAAEARGSVTPAAQISADINLKLRGANVAPLLGLDATQPLARDASLSSHVTRDGDKLRFGDIDATVAGSRLRGRLDVALADQGRFDGELGMDKLDLPQAFALLIGSAGREKGAPLGRSLLDGWRGRIAFQALHSQLLAGLELQPVSGTLRSDGQAVTIDALKGRIGGGDVRADLDARQTGDGLALSGNLQLDGVDGTALRYRGLAMPAGRASLRMTWASQGRSLPALTGALTGSGTLTLDQARIQGLDPNAFTAATKAGDSGNAISDDQLRQIVTTELQRGSLAVKQAQIPFILRDGRVSVGATTLDADGARAVVSGGYDIVADQVDMRASLTSLVSGPVNSSPQLEVFAVGTPDAMERTVDITGLSSWLALRAIERETRRLDAIDRGESAAPAPAAVVKPPSAAPADEPAASKPVPMPIARPDAAESPLPGSDPRGPILKPKEKEAGPKPPQAPRPSDPSKPAVAPLPPPIEVRPAPGAKAAPKPRGPMVLTPVLPHERRPGL